MARSMKTLRTRSRQYAKRHDTGHLSFTSLRPVLMLAGWRVRSSWFFLLITGLSMLVAVMLVCIVPLFSQVALTAGARGVLQATPQSPLLTLQATSTQISATSVQAITQQLTPLVQQRLGEYLSVAPNFSLQTPNLDMLSPNLQQNGSFNNMQLYGVDSAQAASHLSVQQGQLPQASGNATSPSEPLPDIAITPVTASTLKVGPGSTMRLNVKLTDPTLLGRPAPSAQLTVRVAGIFTPDANDPFWQGMDFSVTPEGSFLTFHALVSNQALIDALAGALASTHPPSLQLTYAPTLVWIYRLDALRVNSSNLDALVENLSTLQVLVANQHTPGNGQGALSGPAVGSNSNGGPPGTLAQYQQRIGIVQIPAALLSLQVLLLVLFFLVMITDLLVQQQSKAIAILRSRGASRGQVTGALATQSLALAVIVLCIGPFLALLAVRLIMQQALLPQEQSALNVLSWSALWSVRGYALAAALVMMLAMFFAIYHTVGRDVLEQRRESARSTKAALNQRLHLDLVAATVALTGYAISQYVVHTQVLDSRSTVLLTGPLALIEPIFLCIAALLLSLRFSPLLLHACSRLAGRARGAAPMLAFAQMARSPRQFVPRALLLAMTTAFALFALVFTATQSSHAADVAAYQTGADFSGFIARQATPAPTSAQLRATYRHIPGIVAVMVGEQEQTLAAGTSQALTINFDAVDAHTLAQTVNWQQWNQNVKLPALLQDLTGAQKKDQPLPALTDAAAWQALNLAPGATFTLQTGRGIVSFVAVGKIPYIPQENAGATNGTIIVNYANYATYARSHVTLNPDAPPLNYVWLHTSQNPALIRQERAALSHGALLLAPLYDREAIAQTLQSDPLTLDLIGILITGTITALLLALLGNWLASWISVQSRQTSFAALRAIGTTPEQIMRVLAWEQGSLYTLALISGLVLGLLLAVTVVPTLVFTSTTGSQGESTLVYTLQSVLPTRLVFSPLLLLVVLALLLACTLVLTLMIRIVLRRSLSQALRLNED
ncbi:MAG: ABC transporter permease [Chloroflexota bacterium]|nr:ABC transporter permease [Chloroflexota bacterium]